MISPSDSLTARRLVRVATVAGALSATLGMVVLVGWYTHTVILIQILPAFVPMQYNTALSFALCGSALVALAHGRMRWVVGLGSVAGVIGLLTLIEYVFGVRMGIDEFLFEHYVTVGTSDPGRMAPNTALCFSLTAAALIGAARTKQPDRRLWMMSALGVMVLALGTIALFGYVTGVETAYGWGRLTRMAVHTSAGFGTLSLGILTLAFREGLAWASTSSAFTSQEPGGERRTIVAVSIGIMALAVMAVGATVISESYSTGLETQRDRLTEMVRSRALMFEAMVRFRQQTSGDVSGGARATALREVIEVQEGVPGFGQTGEVTLARREDDEIVFIVRPPHAGTDFVERVAVASDRAEPMRRALDGGSGSLIGIDYRGERVVAAYAHVVPLDLGIVAKMDLAEVRAPFVRSGSLIAAIALLMISVGAGAIMVSVDPLARRVERQALELHTANVDLAREAIERDKVVSELRERESLLGGIYETYPDLQFVLEADGTILKFNAPHESELYVPPETFLGKRMQDVLPPSVAPLWDDALQNAPERKGVHSFEYSLPQEGGDRDYEGRIGVLPDGRFIAIARDITEQKRAERALHELNEGLEGVVEERTAELSAAYEHLESASRAKDEFLAGMSHELRTPLNTILTLSESMEEGVYGELSSDQLDPLRTVMSSGAHLLSLINDILDLSKIGADKLEVEPAAVRVDDVCKASLRLVNEIAHKKQLRISTSFDPGAEFVHADERRLKQVLVNLLDNAVKFTDPGGEIGLDVTGDVERQQVEFSVWDKGIGLSEDQIGKLFQPFSQLDAGLDRQFGGTGLGLSLVARMTELQGGSVKVESEGPGKGSRFSVVLPSAGEEHEVQLETSSADVERQGSEALLPDAPRMLIVDDNENTLATVSRYFSFKSFRVSLARNGEEAVERAMELQPDIILMDIQMPKMDGLEATRRIRAIDELAGTPIIAVTALAMPGDREKCFDAGVDDYMSKPLWLKALLERVTELMRPGGTQ